MVKINFSGKTVVVTGAGHGFGKTISLAFAERGAKVWACDILENVKETAKQGKGEARVFDLRNQQAIQEFAKEVLQNGPVDILVNNAGGVLGQVGQAIEKVSPEQWQSIFDVNVSAAFFMSQAFAPAMKEQKAGQIINISSGAGLGISLTGIQAYASAKAALIGLTRQLAHELGPWQITVNCIAPGFVLSNPNTEKQWQSYGEVGQKELIESIALKRLGSPDDITNGVLFFASEYASWITGQVLSIDGGK